MVKLDVERGVNGYAPARMFYYRGRWLTGVNDLEGVSSGDIVEVRTVSGKRWLTQLEYMLAVKHVGDDHQLIQIWTTLPVDKDGSK